MAEWLYDPSEYFLIADMGPWLGGDPSTLAVPPDLPGDPNLFELDWWVGDPQPATPGRPFGDLYASYRYRTGPGTTESGFYGGYAANNPPPHFYAAVAQSGGGNWTPAFTPESVTPTVYAASGTAPDPTGGGGGPTGPAANDLFSGRASLTTSAAYDTTGATFESGELVRNFFTDAGSVWFAYVARGDKTHWTLTPTGPGGESSTLVLYDAPDATTAAQASAGYLTDDTAFSDSVAEITWTTEPGRTYWLAVQGHSQLGTLEALALYAGPWQTAEPAIALVPVALMAVRQWYYEFESAIGGHIQGHGETAGAYDARKRADRLNLNVLDAVGRGYLYNAPPYFTTQPPGAPPAGAVGPVEYESMQGAAIPGAQTHVTGYLAVNGDAQSAAGESYAFAFGRLSEAGYAMVDGSPVEPVEYAGTAPPSPDMADARQGPLATAIPVPNVNGFDADPGVAVDVDLGPLDPSGVVALYVFPSVWGLPPEPPDNTGTGGYGELRTAQVNRAAPFVQVPYQPPRFRWYLPRLIQPLRQRQRTDGLAIGAPRTFTRDRSSKQLSPRSGWQGTYL